MKTAEQLAMDNLTEVLNKIVDTINMNQITMQKIKYQIDQLELRIDGRMSKLENKFVEH